MYGVGGRLQGHLRCAASSARCLTRELAKLTLSIFLKMENEMEHARKFLAMLENGKHLAVFSIFIERIATLK